MLTPEDISQFLTRYHNGLSEKEEIPRQPAAVLLPLIETNAGLSLLFTRRSELVKNHKGQVSFPGGAAEEYDQDAAATALREANEEIGLPVENVDVLGMLETFTSSSRYTVTPVVGWIRSEFVIVPNPGEVARVFTVPLSHLSNAKNLELRTLETPWGRREGVVFFEDYDGETVWGFTGLITLRFLQILHLLSD